MIEKIKDRFCYYKERYGYGTITLELKNQGIKQSISRKENSMDNEMKKIFFSVLKTEMFYD